MTNIFHTDRYEILNLKEDRFVNRATVKDKKAHGRIRSVLFLNEQSIGNPNVINWFNRQNELFAQIQSDYIVDYVDSFDAGEIMDSPALVVEQPDKTLADFLSGTDIQPDTAVNIAKRLLAGIDKLHEIGILHLDIRPETIGMSNTADEIKLLSLGNCSPIQSGTISLAPNAKYGAPECYSSGSDLGIYSDTYSVGFLLYEMLCGTAGFSDQFKTVLTTSSDDDRSSKWVNWHVSEESANLLSQVKPEVDDRLVTTVSKMIDKDVSVRSSSIGNIVSSLSAAVGSGGAGMGLTGKYESPSKSKNTSDGKFQESSSSFSTIFSRYWKVLAGGLVGALCLVLVSILFLGKSKQAVPEIQIDTDEINKLVNTSDRYKEIITTVGLQDDPEVAKADESHKLASEAYEKDDFVAMQSHLMSSVEEYSAFLDKKGPIALGETADTLVPLVHKATLIGTEQLPDVGDISTDYGGDNDELESRFVSYQKYIEEIETAISENNRLVQIGSTEEEIDSAFNACKRYTQGCEREWYEDELEREVSIKPFFLDEKEVTVADFQAYVEKFSIKTEAEIRGFSSKVVDADTDFAVVKADGSNWRNVYQSDFANLPIVHVTHADASGYCEYKKQRLPTEAEWEFAARGIEKNTYPWGAEWQPEKLYWAKTETAEGILPVGSFPPSENGLFDLAGGVSEWTSSLNDEKSHAYLKGSSRFDANIANIRSAVRRLEPIDYSGEDVGFRCATELEVWPEQND